MGNRDASDTGRVSYPSAVMEEKCARYALPVAVGHTRGRNFLGEYGREGRGQRASREESGSWRVSYRRRETVVEMGISIWAYILWEVSSTSALFTVDLLSSRRQFLELQ